MPFLKPWAVLIGLKNNFLLFFLPFIVISCGIYTNSLTLKFNEADETQKKLIIIKQYKTSSLNFAGKPLNLLTGEVFLTGSNHLNYPVPADLNRAVLYVFSVGTDYKAIEFNQKLFGEWEVNYDIKLERDTNWADNYRFSIKPLLLDFLNDEQLPNYKRAIVHNWMLDVEKNL